MNTVQREAIRKTWASKESSHIKSGAYKIFFLLGNVEAEGTDFWIFKETEKYRDIIQVNITDTMSNLVYKSLASLKLKRDHCGTASFYVKVDDDVLLNLHNLETAISKAKMKNWGIMGSLNIQDKVKRKYSRAVSKKTYPFTFYPKYETGACYVITKDLIEPLISASKKMKTIKSEDAYITGILGRMLKVKHYKQEGFSFWKSLISKDECEFIKGKISLTNFESPKKMEEYWHKAQMCS
ncbi:unnamed protein product [Dimorphilus gyrociliatus]|uniref:Hexosyltransferase n=1 Tax=Dimorphilus gyrociliatus TaxID=2664684 RepID=A0A7I8VGI8_9ANNE|nr:unnamed protein product [Dimorphilus gyrociliatus]